MDDLEDIKIKAELDKIAKNIDAIINKVENEDPGRPTDPDSNTEAGNEG